MLIGEIKKNTMEKIRVSAENYRDHDFIDVRVYFEDDQGEWKPTKKGISIAPNKLSGLIELLEKARKS